MQFHLIKLMSLNFALHNFDSLPEKLKIKILKMKKKILDINIIKHN